MALKTNNFLSTSLPTAAAVSNQILYFQVQQTLPEILLFCNFY